LQVESYEGFAVLSFWLPVCQLRATVSNFESI